MNPPTHPSARPEPFTRGSAFTVIELLVAVSVLSVIVLALYSMFDQTQRAMQSNATQTDVMEGGRATMELLTRELEQARATGQGTNVVNFYAALSRPVSAVEMPGEPQFPEWRPNVLQDVFWTSRGAPDGTGVDKWTGLGYRVVSDTNGVGTLYRFATNIVVSTNRWRNNELFANFLAYANTNQDRAVNPYSGLFQRVTDGVVHFRVRAYTTNGVPLNFPRDSTNEAALVLLDPLRGRFPVSSYLFTSNAIPAYVDVELGILESLALDRYRQLPNSRKAEYLAKQAGRIHLFQQPVRLPAAQ